MRCTLFKCIFKLRVNLKHKASYTIAKQQDILSGAFCDCFTQLNQRNSFGMER